MKKTLLLAASLCLAVGLASCKKGNELSGNGLEAESCPTSRVCFRACRTDMSKSGISDDGIANIAVAVFDSNGTLDACGYAAGNEITLNLKQGPGKSIYTVCNANKNLFATVLNDDGMDKLVCDGLSVNEESEHIEMSGKKEGVDIDRETQSIDVKVFRRVAKISIGNIRNNLPAGFGSLTINNIYISNVPAETHWFTDAAPLWWVNPKGEGIYYWPQFYKGGINSVLLGGKSNDFKFVFYTYPNLTDTDSNADEWCPRHTRLVISATILGEHYYYPISINSLSSSGHVEANYHYNIKNVTINHLGSDSPEEAVTSSSVLLSIEVQPWELEEVDDIIQ